MEQLTTYRVTGKTTAVAFIFKYDLNGDLKVFELVGKPLNEDQKWWLFGEFRFPIDEGKIIIWAKNPTFTEKFKVEKIPADLSFERLWEAYNYKMGKKDAEKSFKKLGRVLKSMMI